MVEVHQQKNPIVNKPLESKLPDGLKKEFLVYATKSRKSELKDQFEKHFYKQIKHLKNEDIGDSHKKKQGGLPNYQSYKATR